MKHIFFKIIFLIAILGIIYMVISKYKLEKSYIEDSIIIKGNVLEIKRKTSESDGFPGKTTNSWISLRYSFTYNSVKYENTAMWILGEFYYISQNDKTVLVQLLKDNPTENRLYKSSNGVNLIMD